MSEKRCEYVSPRGKIRCELDSGHPGMHRAWDDDGIPTLLMSSEDLL